MATPEQYLSTFELYGDGQAVLTDLMKRFGGPSFTRGAPDQTAYNCGDKAVIEHIARQIHEAERPRQPTAPD